MVKIVGEISANRNTVAACVPRRGHSGQTYSRTHNPIVQLQRQLGNRAVKRLLQSGFIQAKMSVGQTNDNYEQEADRVAEQMIRMPEPAIQPQKST